MPNHSGDAQAWAGPVLVFDGGCPFCSHFAERSALASGIAGLQIVDGRSNVALRRRLARQGFRLRNGAMVLDGEHVLHGAAAIQWLCNRMQPSDALLSLLAPLFARPERARALYPLLLAARAVALGIRRLPIDPDRADPASELGLAATTAALPRC